MYAVIENDKFIAFHDEKRVVRKYVNRIRDSNEDKSLCIVKLGNKKAKKINRYYDLYLVRYGDIYVQSGYLDIVELADPQIEYDHQYAKDVLMRLLELGNIDDEKQIHIEETICLLDQLIRKEKKYTPSLEELERMEDHYGPYLYNKDY